MKKYLLLKSGFITIIFNCVFSAIFSQTINCVTLKPDSINGKDAIIFSGYPVTNFEPSTEFISVSWTCQGNPCTDRSLIQFDLSSIPANATVTDARLNLFAHPAPIIATTAMFGTANTSLLQRITSSWDENLVTWNTQPTTTTLNQVTLPQSVSSSQDYLNIDVKNLVQDMIYNPLTSFGFMLRLQTEVHYNAMTFASSDYPDTTYLPSLVVCYTLDSINCIYLKPGSVDGKDAVLASGTPMSNSGNSTEFITFGWTCQGDPCVLRSLIQFDLSNVPLNAIITEAKLDLFAHLTPQLPTAMYGNANTSWLQRVTNFWDEQIVTWSTQPLTSSINEVTLSQSTSPYQDYLNIDVTDLVQDMIDNPASSFGFMLRLQNEVYYNAMTFASSDYPDTLRHPGLRVCYLSSTAINENQISFNNINVYPNPFSDKIAFGLTIMQETLLKISLFDLFGKEVFQQIINEKNVGYNEYVLNFKNTLPLALYVLQIKTAETVFTKKIIRTE